MILRILLSYNCQLTIKIHNFCGDQADISSKKKSLQASKKRDIQNPCNSKSSVQDDVGEHGSFELPYSEAFSAEISVS